MADGDGPQRHLYEDLGDSITGNIHSCKKHDQIVHFSTLDEPIGQTVLRDAKAIGRKFLQVLYPQNKKDLILDWDLWGPLFLCTLMAMILHSSREIGSTSDGGPAVTQVFAIVWVGSIAVTLNSKLLGGNTSFFQSVCVLGYCLLPSTIALIFCKIILWFPQTIHLFILRLFLTVSAFTWAVYAATFFFEENHFTTRKALVLYPVFLFYFVISWLVISHEG